MRVKGRARGGIFIVDSPILASICGGLLLE